MRQLCECEIDEVQGAWGPLGALQGAAVAATGHLGNAATTGDLSWSELARDVAIGAATGAILGPASHVARFYFAQRAAGVIGASAGLADTRFGFRR